ncbi:alpha/beta fold hydrolase [Actinoplanes sp. CA-054009]
MTPPVRYARHGELSLAYQVLGTGPEDLLFLPGFVTHLDLAWEEPRLARFLRGLAGFARLIWFDRRGTGLSDPAPAGLTLSDAVEDVRVVLHAAGSERPALFGVAVGAAIATEYALRHPAGVRSLVLWAGHARLLAAPGYPAGWTPSFLAEVLAGVDEHWAAGAGLDAMNPSLAGDSGHREWFVRHARAAASPRQARELFGLCAAADFRDALPGLDVPALLLHRTGDPWLSVEHSRWVAAHLPDARLIELPGADHWPWIGDAETPLAEIGEFLTGVRPDPAAPPPRPGPPPRPASLTPREREVMALAVQGLSARDIAAHLFISERTVESHIEHAYRKLGVTSRIELVRRAGEWDF